MSTCIIHVGMHKTGTTSIQQSLNGYSDDEFYYASLGRGANHSFAMFSLFSPTPEEYRIHRANGIRGKRLKNHIDLLRLDLERSITEANGRSMIVSGEAIARLPKQALIELKNYFSIYFNRIQIEAYIRPPAAYINSSFQQKVKGGLGSMDVEKMYRPYENSFAKLDKVFGLENVHLRKFDPKAFANECVVTDFCLRLGINLSEDKISTVNESLSQQALGLLYIYNKFVGDLEAPPLRGREAISLVNELNIKNKKKFRFSSKLLAPILEAKRNDIRWMERRMVDSLHEDLPNHEQGDVQNESDLLQIDADVIKQLRSCLGKSAPKNVTGDTPDEVVQLVHAVRKKMELNITRNQPKVKLRNEKSMLNHARINRAEPGVVTGWAIGPDPDQPVKVRLLVNGKKRASTTANEMRKGIQERGIHPTGRCGFVFKFGTREQLEINDEVSIELAGCKATQGQPSLKVTASDQTQKITPAKMPDHLLKKVQAKSDKLKEIILHVGHQKTGSSFIQSALALSAEKLISLGIDYPEHASFTRAKKGFISSGNVVSTDEWLNDLVTKTINSKQHRVLFSSEALFNRIWDAQHDFPSVFHDYKVTVILCIRDPMDHMLSSYGEAIKRHKKIFSPDCYSEKYHLVKKVGGFIDFCTQNNYNLKVINYSRQKRDLAVAFEESLHILPGTLKLPASKTVNRSLTASELELQRLFNLHLDDGSSKFISDILCNELPDVVPEKLKLSNHAASKFVDRIFSDIESVNIKLDEKSRYLPPSDLTTKNEVDQDIFTFSKEQLEILIRSICKELNGNNDMTKNKERLSSKLRNSVKKIKRSPGD